MVYTWYVEPLNKQTNDVLASTLEEISFYENIICADGLPHNLWQCPVAFISCLKQSSAGVPSIKFRVFNCKGNGRIRECTFLYS
jgi:hypothetical protein